MESIKELINLVERENPVFNEPWQADSFIMAVALSHSGLFSWSDWVAHFAQTIKDFPQTQDESTGDAYYRQWLRCFEELLGRLGLVNSEDLEKRVGSWRTAYLLTPHGSPVELAFAARKALEIGVVNSHDHHDHQHDADDHHHGHRHDDHHHHHGLFADYCAMSSGPLPFELKPLKVFPKRVSQLCS